MKIIDTLKSRVNKVNGVLERSLKTRESRVHNPEFKIAIAKENAEFMDILRKLEHNTYEAGFGFILRTAHHLYINRFTYATLEAGIYDAFKLIYGKDGAPHSALKAAGNILHLYKKGIEIVVKDLLRH